MACPSEKYSLLKLTEDCHTNHWENSSRVSAAHHSSTYKTTHFVDELRLRRLSRMTLLRLARSFLEAHNTKHGDEYEVMGMKVSEVKTWRNAPAGPLIPPPQLRLPLNQANLFHTVHLPAPLAHPIDTSSSCT